MIPSTNKSPEFYESASLVLLEMENSVENDEVKLWGAFLFLC